jgi:hypothetical protein
VVRLASSCQYWATGWAPDGCLYRRTTGFPPASPPHCGTVRAAFGSEGDRRRSRRHDPRKAPRCYPVSRCRCSTVCSPWSATGVGGQVRAIRTGAVTPRPALRAGCEHARCALCCGGAPP